MSRIRRAGLWLLAILASFGAGWGACILSNTWLEKDKPEEAFSFRLDSGMFSRPLLDCESDSRRAVGRRMLTFGESFHRLCAEVEKRAGLHRVGVYFRDLENGPWLGYREKEAFRTGGVEGVVLAVAFLRQTETNPQLLETQVTFTPSGAVSQASRYAPQIQYVPGRQYPALDLIKRVLQAPDAEAARMLRTLVDPKNYLRTLGDIDPAPAQDEDRQDRITAVGLGRFFRVLFNASYLQPTLSENVLGFLTGKLFSKGLVAGVSPDVLVSHKYGEDVYKTSTSVEIVLHDCGIVYSPFKPYLLCVMTAGTDFLVQESAIRDIASLVNSEIMAWAKDK